MSNPNGRTFDRVPHWDPQNGSWLVRATLTEEQLSVPRAYTWRCDTWLDQGPDGACVGFSSAHEAAARPKPWRVTYDDAMARYHGAQDRDQWPGNAYVGSSVLGGAKDAVARGQYDSYYWARTLQETIIAVGYKGPVILGIPWMTGMMQPDSDGLIHTTGIIEGYHAILLSGVNPLRSHRARLHQSWGKDWRNSLAGDCLIDLDELGPLIEREDSEVLVPVGRHDQPRSARSGSRKH